MHNPDCEVTADKSNSAINYADLQILLKSSYKKTQIILSPEIFCSFSI